MEIELPGQAKPCPSPVTTLEIIKANFEDGDRIRSFSSFSPSLYDTAWLSLVHKENDLRGHLFPQCLDMILRAQKPDGTWPVYASPIDGILVSLASLLSVATHKARGSSSKDETQTYTKCIQLGRGALQKLLQTWDVESTVHVGFELLVTSLIRQLEGFSIQFEFPGRAKLMLLYDEKISKFSPKILYSPKQTTLLHSVEAFVGILEFGKMAHHCSEHLGLFGSPAATAAYLIHSPEWDGRAERYLRTTFQHYGSTGNVPSAFPTSLFEISWAISSLTAFVSERSSLGGVDLSLTIPLFLDVMNRQGSLVGFAPGIPEDADDTSRNLLMLMRLGRLGFATTADIAPLVDKFEGAQCFKTYEAERNPSFSANCNVVLALLESDGLSDGQYFAQIEKALLFLLNTVEKTVDNNLDKWNISPEYTSMLLLEVITQALRQYDAGRLHAISEIMFTNRMLIVLCRTVTRLLASQRSDGSWGHSIEVTSYSIIGLLFTLRLPWDPEIRQYLTDRVSQGKNFLAKEYPIAGKMDYLWVEKTTFQSSLLRMTYSSIALYTEVAAYEWSNSMAETLTYTGTQLCAMKKLFTKLPLLHKVPSALLDLALVEAKLHTRNLTTGHHSILPQTDLSRKRNAYLGYIPVIWLLGNQINKQSLSTGVIIEMLRLSQLTYEIDEYMETAVARLPIEQANALESWIRLQCSGTWIMENARSAKKCQKSEYTNGGHLDIRPSSANENEMTSFSENDRLTELTAVQMTLRKFFRYILEHEDVLNSPPNIQQILMTELSEYLLAHMRQNSDNMWLESRKRNDQQATSRFKSSYFSWVRSTGADHTSCPLAFRFFMCLISTSREIDSCSRGAQAQYLSSSVCQHLATMCRQYNDYGSIVRDAEENNLNSMNFHEFQVECRQRKDSAWGLTPNSGILSAVDGLGSAKQNLMAIAEFERKLMELSFRTLEEVVDSPKMTGALKVLVDVTDLFGQLYVIKDITNRKRKAGDLAT